MSPFVLMVANRADQATEITYAFSQYVKDYVLTHGIEGSYLGDSDATPHQVGRGLALMPWGFFHWDHGDRETLYGEWTDNTIVAIVDVSVAGLLRGCIIDTCSCLSAAELGPEAIKKGALAYLGYNEITYVSADEETKRVMNTAKIALLDGKTAGEAWQLQHDAYGEPSRCGVARLVRRILGQDVLDALRSLRDALTGRVVNVLAQYFYSWNQSHWVLLGDANARRPS